MFRFNRKQWATLHSSYPPSIAKKELIKLKKINKDLSFRELAEIYLPLSRLLNFYINFNLHQHALSDQFVGACYQRTPYIIGITGSVAVGKSTTARILQALLSHWPKHRTVDLVTTDGFLHPNYILRQKNLLSKKGFPESYDVISLFNFISKLKSGTPFMAVPVYSHLVYDIIPGEKKIISQPDILILEGVNILQRNISYDQHLCNTFISDFIDFSIYIDASEKLLQSWYINRFLKFCKNSLSSNPNSHFYKYSGLSEKEATNIARQLWFEVNCRNLRQNILPTREYASLILGKSNNHFVESVRLRK